MSATVLGSAIVRPADNKTGGERAEYFPAIWRALLKTSVRGVRTFMEASKSFQTMRVPTMSPETRESCLFLFHSVSACCVPPRNGTLSKAT
ncbi:hypothetical protein E2C01_098802 [Portunus trituberculatus]|uniref:Uncharacterized protein n=1 Tax=Portunus trituberculatus TaxID=210409 RepID=A0A5B7K9B6_PORTR|nr:hypothetical protein [Portunus trituberculatus]